MKSLANKALLAIGADAPQSECRRSKEFLEKVKSWVGRVTKEQPGRKEVLKRVSVADVVAVVERKKGEV